MATQMFVWDHTNQAFRMFYSSDMSIGSYILQPSLKLEIGKAGTLEFTVLPNDYNYSIFERMKTLITVYQDENLIFRGRVISVSCDFYKQKKVTCEGDLGFLLDSIFPPYEHTRSITRMFTDVISNHNDQMAPEINNVRTGDVYKMFTVGNVTVPNASSDVKFEITSFEDSSSVIEGELIDSFGGILQTRTENGVTYIDYLADPFQAPDSYATNSQEISFGLNLMDIQSEPPIDEVFTIIYPIGKDKNVQIDGKFLQNDAAVAKYGRIVRCEQWNDVSSKSTLRDKAQEFLDIHSAIYPDDLTVKAIDLHYLDPVNHPMLKLCDKIRCYSEPHGIDFTLVCLEVEYNFTNPENNSYKIGSYIPSDDREGNKIVKKKSNGKKKTKLSKKAAKTSKNTGKNNQTANAAKDESDQNKGDIADVNSREIKVGADDTSKVSLSGSDGVIDLYDKIKEWFVPRETQ